MLTIAVPKGRILTEVLPIMARAGVVPEAGFGDESDRRLRFSTDHADIDLIRVRAFDVATFVAHGAAQIGVVGSDVIDEFSYPELYAPVDLGVGRCRISVAARAGVRDESHVRVATKYPSLTRRFYEARGVQAAIVKLNGAMELAPTLGLASRIVDLVSTGRTLRDNGLVELDVIAEVSARLIVNRAALKIRDDVAPLVEAFRAAVACRPSASRDAGAGVATGHDRASRGRNPLPDPVVRGSGA
jgi:ATP phosphoribosyltransferase